MSDYPRIAVITVVLNGAKHLEETILNVIRHKSVTAIDYLIVDGGSTDGSVDIIKKYADHIAWWVSEPDRGIYDAMNKGWAAAPENSYIIFLGSGDQIVSLPDTSQFQNHDVLYGTVQMGEDKIFWPSADYHLKLYNALHHQALLVNKGLHPPPPFNLRFPVYADFDFNQRLKKSGTRFVYSDDFIGYACPGGISDRQCFIESLQIIVTNYGIMWATFALAGYASMKLFPVLKRLRPIQKRC